MASMAIDDIEAWKRFFYETRISIGVETALPWIETQSEIAPHIKRLVESILFILASLGARITPRATVPGQDFDERELGEDAFLISHHSIGTGDRICRFKHSYRAGYFSFDPLGYGGFSEFAQTRQMLEPAWTLPAQQALAYAHSLRLKQIQANASKYAQPPVTQEGPPPGYVFLALQMPRDTVMRLSPCDPLEFYRRVVMEAGNNGLPCVVKRHPCCIDPDVTKFLSTIATLPFVTISELSINQLLPGAERVVVINSTVGLEALIHGRPTLTFAASEYAPLTTRIADIDDIRRALTSPPWFDDVKVAQFLHYFFEHYCVQAQDENAVLRKLQESLSILPLKFGWSVERKTGA